MRLVEEMKDEITPRKHVGRSKPSDLDEFKPTSGKIVASSSSEHELEQVYMINTV
jgi:hypothetical protein